MSVRQQHDQQRHADVTTSTHREVPHHPTHPQRVSQQVLKHNATMRKERRTALSVRIGQLARLPPFEVATVGRQERSTTYH